MKITAEIKNDDGAETIKPIAIDTDIPEFDEFEGQDNFLWICNILLATGSSYSRKFKHSPCLL